MCKQKAFLKRNLSNSICLSQGNTLRAVLRATRYVASIPQVELKEHKKKEGLHPMKDGGKETNR
jgi:hypothetical protein